MDYIYCLIKGILELTIFQQAHYDIKKYFKHFLMNILYYDLIPFLLIVLLNLKINTQNEIIVNIMLVGYSIIYLLIKTPLKFTKRIIRLCFSSAIFLSLSLWVDIFIFSEFLIIPLLFLHNMVSKILNYKYLILAKRKLRSYTGIKIGITGSFGKTSVKNILEFLLSRTHLVLKSENSYNTILGLSKMINDNQIDKYEILIFEFGADRKNDIANLMNFINPDLSILVSIGKMHLSSFGGLDGVINEKKKIIDMLNGKRGIINLENEIIRTTSFNNSNLVSYGINHGDIRAINIIETENGYSFSIKCFDKIFNDVRIKLNGDFSILNILATIAVIYSLNLDINKYLPYLPLVKNYKNRLTMRVDKGHTILDDSFNSNPVGFKGALKEIQKYKGERFIITPGIVDLAKYDKDVYKELAKSFTNQVDVIILVGFYQTRYLRNYLNDYKMNVFCVRSFKKAYSLYLKLRNNYKETVLLIENDLPDIYRVGIDW